MPGSPQSTAFDLDDFSEDTRRRLYDVISRNLFFNDGVTYGEEEPLPYTAEAAGLQVHFLYGRWIATWTRREVKTSYAEVERYEVLRIKESNETDFGLMLHEV